MKRIIKTLICLSAAMVVLIFGSDQAKAAAPGIKSEGLYRIKNSATGKYISCPASPSMGKVIVYMDFWDTADGPIWKITASSNGAYYYISAKIGGY